MLEIIRIRSKIGENGTKQMEIVNSRWQPLPIPSPDKVNGFECIEISYIDQNVIKFLLRFHQLFTSCPIHLIINVTDDRILEFILRKIWPVFGNKLCAVRVLSFHNNAMPLGGQAVAKWLFTRLPDNGPKVLSCCLLDDANLKSTIGVIKAKFAKPSTSVSFIVVIWFPAFFAYSFEPFNENNELTREQLTFKKTNNSRCFLLVRCPIAREESKWTEWEEEAIGWEFLHQPNRINIQIDDEDNIGDGLLDATPGPSDQQQK